MTQSTDTQLNNMRDLRDKLDPSSAEHVAMSRAIIKYEHQEATIMVHDRLVYESPKNFYPMFLDELQAIQDEHTYRKRIVMLVFGIYAAVCFYMLFGSAL